MHISSKILEPNTENITLCADLLGKGEVVALPTETVYGLAANGLDPIALRKIFEVKGRPLIDPLIIHFKDLDSALPHIQANAHVEALAKAYWPGPLTMVVPKKSSIPDIATACKDSVAIRIPANPIFRAVLKPLAFPLAAPSANPFGYVSPTQAQHVQHTLGSRIQAILDGGEADYGLESTIIDLRPSDALRILRHGPITQEQLEVSLGCPVIDQTTTKSNDRHAQLAPGSLTQHYSPNTQLVLMPLESTRSPKNNTTDAFIFLKKPSNNSITEHTYWLSDSGDLKEIAHNLFGLIQQLDQMQFDRIHIQLAPDTDLGKAINDRIRRAAAKFN